MGWFIVGFDLSFLNVRIRYRIVLFFASVVHIFILMVMMLTFMYRNYLFEQLMLMKKIKKKLLND